MLSITVTNPMEVVKTRLQLQGELKTVSERPYKGIAHAFQHIYKHEGVRGLQRGLFPAYLAQATLNGGRLGFYPVIKRFMNNTPGNCAFPHHDVPCAFLWTIVSQVCVLIYGYFQYTLVHE